MRNRLLAALLLFFASASTFGAELSLLAGYRDGGPSGETGVACLGDFRPCPEKLVVEAREGEAFGLIADLPIRGDELMFEVLLNHQNGELDGRYLPVGIRPELRRFRFDLTYLHVGLLRQWPKARVSPFVAVGVGIAQIETPSPAIFLTREANGLSGSVAGGVKIGLNDWLAVRVEGRGYWADLPYSAGGNFLQLEFSSGLTFKL